MKKSEGILKNIMKRNRENRGFSLFELVIVVAVISIAAAIAVPTFLSWAPKFRLKSATDDIAKNLIAARMTAISQNRDVVVTFFTADRKYIITHKEGTNEIELPRGVNFGALPLDTVTFNPYGQADVNIEIKIYSDYSGLPDNKRKVTVRAITGIIKIYKEW